MSPAPTVKRINRSFNVIAKVYKHTDIYIFEFQATTCVRHAIISSLVSHKLAFIGVYFSAISGGNDLITD